MESAVHAAPAWLRGGPRPHHVAIAVVLGAVAGATAGWNLTFVLLVSLALLHHGSLLATVAAGFIGCAAALIGSNLTTAIGSFCCEKTGIGGVIESLGHGPVVALLGWHQYDLLGGALLALILSLPAAHALARRCSAANEEDADAAPAPLLRPWGWSTALVWLLGAAATLHIAAPQRVGNELLMQISAAAGAPVTADRIRYDLFGGRLELDGVRIRDLDEPGRVALRVDSVTADVEPGLLLRGRLHVAEIELSGLTYDADPQAAISPKLFSTESSTALRADATADDSRSLDPTQPVEAAGFVRDWNEMTIRLTALSRLVAAVESTADLESGHAAGAQRLQGYRRPALEPRDAISGRSLPLVQVRKLRLAGLPAAWSLGEEAHVDLVNLTSRPATTPRGAQLICEVPRHHLELTIGFRLSGGERRHEVALNCDTCAAGDLVDLRRMAAAGIETTAGPTLALRGRGSAGRDRLELALACDVVGFRPTSTAARFGNLDAAVWRAGIDRVGGLRLDATLTGRWGEPHLQVTPAAAVDQLKHQLRSVGEHALVKAVEAGRFPPSSGVAPTAVAPPVAASPVAVTTPKVAAPVAAVPATTPKTEPTTEKKPEEVAKSTAETKPVAKPAEAVTPASAAAPVLAAPTQPSTPAAAPLVRAPNVAPSSVTPNGVAPPTVTPAMAIAELRQPTSVLDPSSRPGQAVTTAGGVDSFNAAIARTRPTTPAPAAVARSTASPYTTAPSVRAPVAATTPATRPSSVLPPNSGGAVVISDDFLPREEPAASTSLVNKWFGPKQTPKETNPSVATQVPPAGRQTIPTEPEKTAAKPWFPRIRKFLGEDLPETDSAPMINDSLPEDALVERTPPRTNGGEPGPRGTSPSMQPQFDEQPVPQTAREPWYDRLFR
jgi:hypothetical protein